LPAGGGFVSFYGISFVSPTTGWVVGATAETGNIIIKSVSSGFQWTSQTAPTMNPLTGVSFTSLDTGTAVEFSGTIIHTTNGGTDWALRQSTTLRMLKVVSFIDTGQGLWLAIAAQFDAQWGGLTDVAAQGPSPAPSSFVLWQNCPNPFNPSTRIKFKLPSTSNVLLSVCDMLGREVSVLVNERKGAEVHTVCFDTSRLLS
jgi:hypothetical protein